jgi:hypothetical protein
LNEFSSSVLSLSVIDFASGCSELDSQMQARQCKSFIVKDFWFSGNLILKFFPTSIRSFTSGFPYVKVPVLSKTTIDIELIFSNTLPPLINTPNLAATPVPTITAVGVASPNAHGHAITSIEMPKVNAKSNLVFFPKSMCSLALEYTIENHTIQVRIARITIAGTKYLAILSATA